MDETIIEKSKNLLIKTINDFGCDPYHLLSHVPEAERWAKYMAKKYTEVDEEILLLSVWLHDVGHYPTPTEIDHAVRSEQRAKEFLEKENYDKEKLKAVLHCVRAHRCKDVMPETLEAKIMAFVDSASHMTDFVYLDMAKIDKQNKEEFRAYAKMERDMRDLGIFPEIQSKMQDLYSAWHNLIKKYEELDLE